MKIKKITFLFQCQDYGVSKKNRFFEKNLSFQRKILRHFVPEKEQKIDVFFKKIQLHNLLSRVAIMGS